MAAALQVSIQPIIIIIIIILRIMLGNILSFKVQNNKVQPYSGNLTWKILRGFWYQNSEIKQTTITVKLT